MIQTLTRKPKPRARPGGAAKDRAGLDALRDEVRHVAGGGARDRETSPVR